MFHFQSLKKLLILIPFLSLVACNTTQSMKMDKVVKNTSFKKIEVDESKTSFALAKLVSDLERDAPIFAFPKKTVVQSIYCNYGIIGDATVTYSGGKEYLGDWSTELGDVFFETFERLGYSVAGNPDDLFGQATSVNSAEYLVGGRLISSKGNICHQHHWWDGRPLYTYGGEMTVTFEWSVLNTLTKSVVIKEKTSGYAKIETPIAGGIPRLFEDAFADAADSFAKSKQMKKLAIGEQLESVSYDASDETIKVKQGKDLGSFDINKIKSNIVTIRIGTGHGSGFLIGANGYILTKAHVVGDAKFVQVLTNSGIEIQGDVIKRNKARDVALVKIPISSKFSLKIDTELPDIATEVYAVGTPINESLNTTVTKGIVSAIRSDATNGLSFIQSDASISPGNSGGPLFNNAGHVIGVSVAKFTGSNAEGLGLFIPIGDALKSMNLSVK